LVVGIPYLFNLEKMIILLFFIKKQRSRLIRSKFHFEDNSLQVLRFFNKKNHKRYLLPKNIFFIMYMTKNSKLSFLLTGITLIFLATLIKSNIISWGVQVLFMK